MIGVIFNRKINYFEGREFKFWLAWFYAVNVQEFFPVMAAQGLTQQQIQQWWQCIDTDRSNTVRRHP
jgi:hypothetical protein